MQEKEEEAEEECDQFAVGADRSGPTCSKVPSCQEIYLSDPNSVTAKVSTPSVYNTRLRSK